ncbi:hypothetical protein J2Y70_000743 [Xanthomonas translucens]|nr:hypothetical protein [Xanthomonas translucens]
MAYEPSFTSSRHCAPLELGERVAETETVLGARPETSRRQIGQPVSLLRGRSCGSSGAAQYPLLAWRAGQEKVLTGSYWPEMPVRCDAQNLPFGTCGHALGWCLGNGRLSEARSAGPSTRWETIMETVSKATHGEPWNKCKIIGQKRRSSSRTSGRCESAANRNLTSYAAELETGGVEGIAGDDVAR